MGQEKVSDIWPGVRDQHGRTGNFQGPGGPGDGMDGMTELRAEVGELKVDMAAIKATLPTLCTQAELHKEFNLQTWRIIGAVLACAGLVVAGIKFLH